MIGQGAFLAWRREHALPPGALCRNCGTVLQGPWCHACGQSGHDFHRHASHLVWETIESVFHADGRLWRTLPSLIAHPARLTRDYLAGKRAPQIPPLRLFLVVLLVFFLIANWQSRDVRLFHFDQAPKDARAEMMKSDISLGLPPAWDHAASDWIHVHAGRAFDHPDELAQAMRERAENFAFLMLPISAFILAAMFARRRGVVLFDHLIFCMHSLSFQGMLLSTAMLTSAPFGGASNLLLWAAPIHLFRHMRGTYDTGVAGTLVRMAVLFLISSVAFGLLVAGLLIVGLDTLHA